LIPEGLKHDKEPPPVTLEEKKREIIRNWIKERKIKRNV